MAITHQCTDVKCPKCKGTGQVVSILAYTKYDDVCPTAIPEDYYEVCPACQGNKTVRNKK
jgi:DnaJ-class molecular chaperone